MIREFFARFAMMKPRTQHIRKIGLVSVFECKQGDKSGLEKGGLVYVAKSGHLRYHNLNLLKKNGAPSPA